jgi:hypothetical protein
MLADLHPSHSFFTLPAQRPSGLAVKPQARLPGRASAVDRISNDAKAPAQALLSEVGLSSAEGAASASFDVAFLDSRETTTAAVRNKLLSPPHGSRGFCSHYPMLKNEDICFLHFVARKRNPQGASLGCKSQAMTPLTISSFPPRSIAWAVDRGGKEISRCVFRTACSNLSKISETPNALHAYQLTSPAGFSHVLRNDDF